MKLIHPRIEILEQQPGLQGMYDMIELCGKTSYKSPVQGGQVAKNFVSARMNEGHYAVLEFGTVYLKTPYFTLAPKYGPVLEMVKKYQANQYSKVSSILYNGDYGYHLITTNFRVLAENDWIADLKYWCEPTEYHQRRYTARVITDRGTTHELVRHRSMSFVQESTRYCNYSKDKFDNELTFILPPWMEIFNHEGHYDGEIRDGSGRIVMGEEVFIPPKTPAAYAEQYFCSRLWEAEKHYMFLIKNGWTPQEARQILPNALKTEICMCGFLDAWKHFFDLRYHGTTGKPHPSMYEVAEMLKFGFEEKGIAF